MIETVFMLIAMQNGSMTVTQVPDEATCHAVIREGMLGIPLSQRYIQSSPIVIGGRCVVVRDGKAVPYAPPAPSPTSEQR